MKYDSKYIQKAKAKIDEQKQNFEQLILELEKNSQKNSFEINSEIEKYEKLFFNNLTVVLDEMFTDRKVDKENLETTNPSLELHLLAAGLKSNNAKMDFKNLDINPSNTILKYRSEMEIKMTKAQFEKLSVKFFDSL